MPSASASSPGRSTSDPAPSTRRWSAGRRRSCCPSATSRPTPPGSATRAAVLICQVQTLKDARDVAAKGADVVVAQGTEAGGHGANRATLPLVPAVVDAVAPVPVAAAGGIADGRGLAAALMLGAEAVLVGTRFWATREALGHPNQKALIERTGGDDTLRTRAFDHRARALTWPEPWTGRAIRNAFSDAWHDRDDALRAEEPALRERFFAAQRDGDTGHGGHLRRRGAGPDRRPAGRRRAGRAHGRRRRRCDSSPRRTGICASPTRRKAERPARMPDRPADTTSARTPPAQSPPAQTPLAVWRARVAAGHLTHDPAQALAAEKLKQPASGHEGL